MPNSRRVCLLAVTSIALLWGCHSDNPVTSEEPTDLRYSLGILRESWHIASPPVDFTTLQPKPARGSHDPALIWFNPYYKFDKKDIYNDVQQNDQVYVLGVQFRPDESVLFNAEQDNATQVWAGIMRGLPRGAWDQSQTVYLELRLGVRTLNPTGPATTVEQLGRLHVDLGRIDEDVDADGVFDTEDLDGNGLLSAVEDIGLDITPDESEPGYDPQTNPDPNGDDWDFVAWTPDDVSRINGTEGNGIDYPFNIPDSEDLGGPGQFDRTNSYYEFTIDLDNDSEFLVEGSEKASERVPGLIWKTYQIPLWDAESYRAVGIDGAPDSTQIQFARLWRTNATVGTEMYIAYQDLALVREDTTSNGAGTR